MTGRTKNVATIGPASRTPRVLRQLLAAGVNVFRLNFSHGTHDEHSAAVADIRALSRDTDRHVAILQDLCGPKMRLQPMVGDLLEFVRSRLGSSLPIEPAPMDMASAIKAAMDEACAGQPDCTPALNFHGDSHGIWDRGRIEQMLQNLIGNALQHGNGNRTVTVTLTGGAEQVLLTIHNYGPPIPKEALSSLFDPLVRSANEELGSPSTSLGLGLFIVKEVVTAHQGSIEVSSSEADGTTFTVTLPRVSHAE